MKQEMNLIKNNKNIIIIGILLILISFFGITYAYFKITPSRIGNNSVITNKLATLSLTYQHNNSLTLFNSNISDSYDSYLPFTITNNGTAKVLYNLRWDQLGVNNNIPKYANLSTQTICNQGCTDVRSDFTWKLYKLSSAFNDTSATTRVNSVTSGTEINTGYISEANTLRNMIPNYARINSGVTDYYVLVTHFNYSDSIDQTYLMGKEFSGSIKPITYRGFDYADYENLNVDYAYLGEASSTTAGLYNIKSYSTSGYELVENLVNENFQPLGTNLLKLSPDLTFVSRTSYTEPNETKLYTIDNIGSAKAGLTYYGGTDATFKKVDSNNNTVFEKSYGGTGNDYFNGVIESYDNGYYLYGSTTSTSFSGYTVPENKDFFAMKCNSSGNIVWITFFNETGSITGAVSDALMLSDNGIVLLYGSSCNYYLQKLDSDGNDIWSVETPTEEAEIVLVPNTDYFALYEYFVFYTFKFFYDNDGNTINITPTINKMINYVETQTGLNVDTWMKNGFLSNQLLVFPVANDTSSYYKIVIRAKY